jgi:N-acetylglucosaminyldiphosphoundecaprenol N-acetyl-beta-D-mannosaminyltransferase
MDISSGVTKDFARNTWCLLGLPIDATSMDDTVETIYQSIESRTSCFLSTPNLNFLIASLSDDTFRDSVINSDWVIADGMPLIWISKLLGIPIKERVAGSGLIEVLRAKPKSEKPPVKVFFFGGQEGIAEQSCDILNNEESGLVCVGSYNPGFGTVSDMSTPEIIDKINSSTADFVIVSLGAKKGQAWIEHNRTELNCPVISHLGAVVNFIAGTVTRAPVWIQKIGMEWLWRIYEEPGLFKRYWNDGLTLLRLFSTKVIPYAMYLRKISPTINTEFSADFDVEEKETELHIQLMGALKSEQLVALRKVFQDAAEKRKDIVLDFRDTHYIDSAFIGLLLILHKHQVANTLRIELVNLSDELKKIISYNNVTYLLD